MIPLTSFLDKKGVCYKILKSHGGLNWESIKLSDAEKLHRGLTQEMKDILKK